MQKNMIGRNGKILARREKPELTCPLSVTEQKRKKLAEKMDCHALMANGGKAVVDEDDRLLVPPASVAEVLNDKLRIARAAPKIEFAVIPYRFRYFPEMRGGRSIGPWSSWGQACYYSVQDRFFGAVGDHAWYDPNLHLVEYDCAAQTVRCLPEINTLLQRTAEQFGEAKIHGYPDVYKPPYLRHDHLWFCTYWCRYPEPLEHDFGTGYSGGHIMSYNLEEGDFVDYGVPLIRASWPYHRIDRRRGVLYAIGMFGEFLAWDIDNQEILWAGYPPTKMKWFNRCLLIDEDTGLVYSNNAFEDSQKIIKYDPERNRFSELPFDMPKNTQYNRNVFMRCHTRKRGRDGKFWGLTSLGDLFSFDPVGESLEMRQRLWPLNDAYSVTMDQSPGGRYLYFGVASHGRGYPYGSPVLQHDLETDTTKILAFLHPYYYDHYGYVSGGSYSFKLDERGERLFAIWNGDFNEIGALENKWREYDAHDVVNWSRPSPHDAFGHCATFLMHIPREERVE